MAVCAVCAGGRAAHLARTGLYGEKKVSDGHPGAVRLLWCSRRDAELDLRTLRVSWADGPHGWRRRGPIGHWKRVTGSRAQGDRFEQWSG